jgi:hypothetical protein
MRYGVDAAGMWSPSSEGRGAVVRPAAAPVARLRRLHTLQTPVGLKKGPNAPSDHWTVVNNKNFHVPLEMLFRLGRVRLTFVYRNLCMGTRRRIRLSRTTLRLGQIGAEPLLNDPTRDSIPRQLRADGDEPKVNDL